MHAGTRTELAAMRAHDLGHRPGDIVHAAFDDAAADILDGAGKQPRELRAQRIVRRERRM